MIGLIFGETNFPKEILKKIKKIKKDYTIIDLTKNKIFKSDRKSHAVSIGQIGKILNIRKCDFAYFFKQKKNVLSQLNFTKHLNN